MTNTDTDTEFPAEMAYRMIGASWKRKTFRSAAEVDRWFDKNDGDVAEVRWADR